MSDGPEDDEIDEQSSTPKVAHSEHDLILLARALIAGPVRNDGDIWSLLCASRDVPPNIGPTCASLLEDALGQAWRSLWLRGGARPKPSYTGGKGRLWERHQPTELRFSSATLRLLQWLVKTPFAAPASTIAALPATALEIGDQLMVYFALDATRATPALRVLAAQPFVRAAPLAWLGFSSCLCAGAGGDELPDFASLVAGSGAIVVEALSDELAKRWHASELAKRSMTDPDELVALGTSQDALLCKFLDACDRGGRRDLASFVLDAAFPLIERDIIPAPEQLDPNAPLSARASARTSAGSLLRAIVRWDDWDQQHRGVRFIDDGYASAQLLLHRFERIGSGGVSRVRGWLASLAALAPTTDPLGYSSGES